MAACLTFLLYDHFVEHCLVLTITTQASANRIIFRKTRFCGSSSLVPDLTFVGPQVTSQLKCPPPLENDHLHTFLISLLNNNNLQF